MSHTFADGGSGCDTDPVRRLHFIASLTLSLTGTFFPISRPLTAQAAVVAKCNSAMVSIVQYSFQAGAGNVNDLFRINDVGTRSCSLNGYAHVQFYVIYGNGDAPLRHTHSLLVGQVDNYGRDGNDLGGLATGRPLPTVILVSKNSFASFWVYGRDEPAGLPSSVASRCITSFVMKVRLPEDSSTSTVQLPPDSGFYWCGGIFVHPFVPGSSGSDPSQALVFHFD